MSPLWTVLAALLCAVAGPAAGQAGSRGPHHPRSQVAASHSHTHYRPQRAAPAPAPAPAPAEPPPKLTQDSQLLHDAEHIREDLGGWVTGEQARRMSPEELEFHYFKIHDVDNNTKLDGLEILQAIVHTVHGADAEPAPDLADGTAGAGVQQDPMDDLSYFVELIDRVLAEDDLDQDGYLSYVEYVLGRQRDEMRRAGPGGPGPGPAPAPASVGRR